MSQNRPTASGYSIKFPLTVLTVLLINTNSTQTQLLHDDKQLN